MRRTTPTVRPRAGSSPSAAKSTTLPPPASRPWPGTKKRIPSMSTEPVSSASADLPAHPRRRSRGGLGRSPVRRRSTRRRSMRAKPADRHRPPAPARVDVVAVPAHEAGKSQPSLIHRSVSRPSPRSLGPRPGRTPPRTRAAGPREHSHDDRSVRPEPPAGHGLVGDDDRDAEQERRPAPPTGRSSPRSRTPIGGSERRPAPGAGPGAFTTDRRRRRRGS